MIACISIKANGLLIIYSKHVYALIVLGSYIFYDRIKGRQHNYNNASISYAQVCTTQRPTFKLVR